MNKKLSVLGGMLSAFFVMVGNAFAAADTALQTQVTTLQTYFTDNIPVVIAAFVAISMLLWLLSIAFRSVGVKRPSKVG